MVARRKKLKEQISAGDVAAAERLSSGLKVQKRKEKKQKKSMERKESDDAVEEREHAVQSVEEAASNALALEERKKANRLKREERKKRKKLQNAAQDQGENEKVAAEEKKTDIQGENAKNGVQNAQQTLTVEERKKANRLKREERKKRKQLQKAMQVQGKNAESGVEAADNELPLEQKTLEDAAQVQVKNAENGVQNALALEERKKANRLKREERKKRKQLRNATQAQGENAVTQDALPVEEKKTLENAAQMHAEQDAEALEERKKAKRLKREERNKRKKLQQARNATKTELGDGNADAAAEKHEDGSTEVNGDSNGVETQKKRKKPEEGNAEKGGQKKQNKRNKKVDRWGAPITEETPEAAEMIEEDNGNEKGEEVEYDPKTIYCGGMPYSCTEDEIYNFFAECGAIDAIDYTTFPDTGKFRGLAFITFKTEAGAKNAMELNGADMGGRFLTIQKCKVKPTQQKPAYVEPPAKAEGCTSVYIGNLSWDVTEKDLRQFFKDCKVKGIRLARDRETGDFRGYGHVDFEDDESVEKAVKMDQNELLGRPMKIAYAVPLRKSSQEVHREPRKKTGCFVCGEEGHLSFHCPMKEQS